MRKDSKSSIKWQDRRRWTKIIINISVVASCWGLRSNKTKIIMIHEDNVLHHELIVTHSTDLCLIPHLLPLVEGRDDVKWQREIERDDSARCSDPSDEQSLSSSHLLAQPWLSDPTQTELWGVKLEGGADKQIHVQLPVHLLLGAGGQPDTSWHSHLLTEPQ